MSARHLPPALALLLSVLTVAPAGFAAPDGSRTMWHVSPSGDDAAAGTADKPFATLERARDAARAERARDGDAVATPTIMLAAGIHPRTGPLELDARDSGLVIRGPHDRSARLHAGRPIDRSALRSVSNAAMRDRLTEAARPHVVAIDLRAAGCGPFAALPVAYNDGGGLPELFWNDAPLPLARWPNEGHALMERVLDRGEWTGPREKRRGGTFVAPLDESGDWRPRRWPIDDGIWLEGFWRVPWDPWTVRVATRDPAARSLTHAAAIGGGIGSKFAPKGSLGDGKEPWCAVNLLEEIDRPGEWCLHLPSQTVYLWPPADSGAGPGSLVIAHRTDPLVRLRDASRVRIEWLTIEGSLGHGIEVTGGEDALVAGCLVRNLGGSGVVVTGGRRHAVRSCDFHTLGAAGIILGGGERRSLEPCSHEAVNNDISAVGRRRKTWAAAIHVGTPHGQFAAGAAVGCRVAHNFLHDLPHAAVLYGGNDNLFELNRIQRVATASADVGAFYTRQDWTSRGNLLRHNLVLDSPRANAFYIDDGDSGDSVEENIVVRAACGPFIGGGHDNLVRHNVVVDCPVGIHLDCRGITRGYATNPAYRKQLESMRPSEAPWRDRYPGLDRLLAADLDADGVVGAPHGNVITDNLTIGCGKGVRLQGKPLELRDNRIEGNVELPDGASPFVDASAGDFRPDRRSSAVARLPSLPDIPAASIGLEEDEYRSRVPGRR
jgi:hypothetical protein